MENWQSEYLQFTVYILLTVWFVQKGSPESKELDKRGSQSDREQLVVKHARPRGRAPAGCACGLFELARDRHGNDLAELVVFSR